MEDGAERRILVIVTTIELDPKHDRHSEKLVRSSPARRKNIWGSHRRRSDSCSSTDRRIGYEDERHCWRLDRSSRRSAEPSLEGSSISLNRFRYWDFN
jgi:hypothetical protein